MAKCPPMPGLVYVPTPCPTCGARTLDQANTLCRPIEDQTGERSCEADFNDDGVSEQPTPESLAARDAWIDLHHDCDTERCVAQGASDNSASTWDEYSFPDFIPAPVQAMIRDFWRPEWGRSPRHWLEGAAAKYNGHPPIGALVDAGSITNSGLPRLRGRWVPLWNNIGCVVADDGSHKMSSTCGIQIIEKV